MGSGFAELQQYGAGRRGSELLDSPVVIDLDYVLYGLETGRKNIEYFHQRNDEFLKRYI